MNVLTFGEIKVSKTAEQEQRSCSFCTKPKDEVELLIAGGPSSNVFICNQCVDICLEVVVEHDLPSPLESVEEKRVILYWSEVPQAGPKFGDFLKEKGVDPASILELPMGDVALMIEKELLRRKRSES